MALVALVFAWLRANYPASHPAAEGVLGRLVGLMGASSVAAAVKKGGRDSIFTWFQETHEYREFSRGEFIDLIVEKLEG